MFRFNFWAKPFFTPPPGTGGMENAPPFVPNPLTSPALMVLASTAAAEGHEVQQRLQAAQQQQQQVQQHAQHHSGAFPGRTMDKDLPPPPPPPPFSTAAFMYRPGDPFSPPLYSPLSFVRPELDRRLALMTPGMRAGAFRPLAPPSGSAGDVDVPQSYHSAFSPAASSNPSSAKKPKPEDSSAGTVTGDGSSTSASSASTSSSSEHHQHHPHGAQFPDLGQQHHGDPRPPALCYRGELEDGRECSPSQHGGTIKEERPASLCSSQGYDTVSEPMSDSGDTYERGTPDSEGRSLRSKFSFLF